MRSKRHFTCLHAANGCRRLAHRWPACDPGGVEFAHCRRDQRDGLLFNIGWAGLRAELAGARSVDDGCDFRRRSIGRWSGAALRPGAPRPPAARPQPQWGVISTLRARWHFYLPRTWRPCAWFPECRLCAVLTAPRASDAAAQVGASRSWGLHHDQPIARLAGDFAKLDPKLQPQPPSPPKLGTPRSSNGQKASLCGYAGASPDRSVFASRIIPPSFRFRSNTNRTPAVSIARRMAALSLGVGCRTSIGRRMSETTLFTSSNRLWTCNRVPQHWRRGWPSFNEWSNQLLAS